MCAHIHYFRAYNGIGVGLLRPALCVSALVGRVGGMRMRVWDDEAKFGIIRMYGE